MKNGTHAVYFNNSAHGDDSLLTRELGPYSVLDAVLDGSTGSEGSRASRLTANKLRTSVIENPDHLGVLLREANTELFWSGPRGQTTLTATFKIGDQLHVFNVGDSPAYLFRDGEVIELATLDKLPHKPASYTKCIGMGSGFNYHTRQIALKPGDRLVLATDGITDNIYPDELYERVIRGAESPEEAVGRLERLLEDKRRKNEGREDFYRKFNNDDQTAIIRFV